MTELEKLKEENRKLREIVCFNLLLQNPYLQFEQKKNAAKIIAKSFDVDGAYSIVEEMNMNYIKECCCVDLRLQGISRKE